MSQGVCGDRGCVGVKGLRRGAKVGIDGRRGREHGDLESLRPRVVRHAGEHKGRAALSSEVENAKGWGALDKLGNGKMRREGSREHAGSRGVRSLVRVNSKQRGFCVRGVDRKKGSSGAKKRQLVSEAMAANSGSAARKAKAAMAVARLLDWRSVDWDLETNDEMEREISDDINKSEEMLYIQASRYTTRWMSDAMKGGLGEDSRGRSLGGIEQVSTLGSGEEKLIPLRKLF
ncbi:hypothetical protein EDB83DRAFT_2326054 [Lactarius deliciosus]|nr:hypothetical protein EDB83DRAFT_2326054 [Lactarius deliciosus]